MRRRGGAPAYRHPFPALTPNRVRWVGDYVAFVAAETREQAADAAELIEVQYDPLPAIVSGEAALAADAPRVWEDAPDNICFEHEVGDRAAVEDAIARADRVVRRRFVVNRVTAAAMEPRGAIGDYNPADGRYTIYTTLQRTEAYRADLAQIINVPESRVRVVAGDIGGSFGMKSAIYNEVALVLLASDFSAARLSGPAPARRRSCPTRRPAIMSPRPSWRSTATAIFLLFAPARSRQPAPMRSRTRRVRDELGNSCRGVPDAGDARRGHGSVHKYKSGATVSRQWPSRIRLCHRADGR